MKLYIGIDGGYTGAMAALCPDGTVLHHPAIVQDLGKDKCLDVRANREILRGMITSSRVTDSDVLVAFELSTKNPAFRASNNYTNGKNGEFWRVLLTLEELPFVWVHPQVWQGHVFRGLHGDDTKAKAALTVQQRFPRLSYGDYKVEEIRGTNDAICIALWSRETKK
jgi:hypothetical protein